jgi:hypothetical protein
LPRTGCEDENPRPASGDKAIKKGHALTQITAERSGPPVASSVDVTEFLGRAFAIIRATVASAADVSHLLGRAFAIVRATLHCLFKHGGGPVENSYHHHIVLCCPVCGRVFWREHTPA